MLDSRGPWHLGEETRPAVNRQWVACPAEPHCT